MQFKHASLLALAGLISAQETGTQNLTTVLTSAPNLSNLTSIVSSMPMLLDALVNANNITILAPSDAAFMELMNSPMGSALNDTGLVTALLQYHVLQGVIMAKDITATPAFVPTLLSNTSYANVTGGQVVEGVLKGEDVVFYSGAMMNSSVEQADITFAGGVIHIIDSVLTLPSSVLETAMAANLTALYGAVNATGLVSTVNETPDLTIFAPTNEAFQMIASALEGASEEDIAGILTYHVVAGTVGYSSALTDGMVLTTANGANLTITVDEEGGVWVNSAKVVVPNVLVANGVVHVIDAVLNPASTAAPSPSATMGAPAFPNASSASEIPFTSGMPTPTTMGGEEPMATSTGPMQATGAAAPMMTGAVGAAALFGAGAALFAGF